MAESGGQWLRFGSVVTGTGAVLRDTAVLIAGDRIVQIAPGSSVTGDYEWHPERTLIPGFVDAHVHLSFGYTGDHESVRATAESATPDELASTVAMHAHECLTGGVTTVRDCGDRDFASIGVRDAIRAGRLPGPQVLAAGPPVTVEGGHLNWCGGSVPKGADLAPSIDALNARGADLVKVLASGGGMTAESDPLHPQFTLPQLVALVERAHGHGMRVAAHAHSSEAIRSSVAARVDSIEHCSWTADDGTLRVLDDVVRDIVAEHVAVVLTMAGIQRGLLPGRRERNPAQHEVAVASSRTGSLAGDFEWARRMLDDGARIVIASDAGVRLTSFAEFIDSVRCGILALGIPAARAIELATLVPAGVLGLEGEVGSIEVGKLADLVALDGVVDESSRELPVIAAVWKSGRPVEARLTA